ncbi:hypothetical protein EDB81DRAFT_809660 [Dactylonectria macrodidyma]|uniref:Uncharacterized protein n=1 Tax=Dactylonectria macrodidyma TaxID=307937 RepID=A0A9P9INZ2_9HYPO|nr:hypothetical protein EDB81DRAFT_809660 [Dactylonectria macrodidyma]
MGSSASKITTPPQMSPETARRGLPQHFRLSYKKSLSLKMVCHLSEPDSEPLFSLSSPDGWYSEVLLHDGPTTDDPMLAAITKEGKWGQDFAIILPPLQSAGIGGSKEILRYNATLKKETFWFGMMVGEGNNRHIEKFEWRHSHGSEVKGVGQSRYGWKLVRLGSGNAGEGSQDAADRGDGFTSDGKEIVAVWADVKAFKSMTGIGEFQFLGSGATGELGLIWSLTAVMSYVCIYVHTMRQAAASSAAVAAA